MRASLILFSIIFISCTSLPKVHASNDNVCKDDNIQSEDSSLATSAHIFDVLSDLSGQIQAFVAEKILNQQDGIAADAFPPLSFEQQQQHQQQEKKQQQDPIRDLKKMADDVVQFFSEFRWRDNGTALRPPNSQEYDNFKLDLVMNQAVKIGASSRNSGELWDLFVHYFSNTIEQVKEVFAKDWSVNHVSPFSVVYYMERMEEMRTPSWKRRKHLFQQQLPLEALMELHNALYLSHLAYADTVDIIEKGMRDFLNNSFQLIYAKTEGLPGEPGHFVAIKKEANKKDILPPLFRNSAFPPLEVIIVVRGTKELGDILSDVLFNATDYYNGKAHSGISKSGEWLVAEHLEMLRSLVDATE